MKAESYLWWRFTNVKLGLQEPGVTDFVSLSLHLCLLLHLVDIAVKKSVLVTMNINTMGNDE